jgi:hypothetical protein
MTTHPDPEQLSAYIDGELNDVDRDDLEQHLTGCSECSATLRALRATLADMRALPAPVPSEQESWALRSAITKARKGPAKRYRQWVAAAGTIAAVFAFIVVLGNSRTASSTFSETAGGVNQGAAAPRAAELSLIEVDPTNYTSASAPQVLDTTAFMAPAVGQPSGAPSPVGSAGAGTTSGAPSGSHKSLDTNLSDAQRASYLTAIQRCEQQVLPANTSNLRASRFIVGTFERTPVFFLVYSVTSGSETKLELWVVQRNDCYIRFFVPPR